MLRCQSTEYDPKSAPVSFWPRDGPAAVRLGAVGGGGGEVEIADKLNFICVFSIRTLLLNRSLSMYIGHA